MLVAGLGLELGMEVGLGYDSEGCGHGRTGYGCAGDGNGNKGCEGYGCEGYGCEIT